MFSFLFIKFRLPLPLFLSLFLVLEQRLGLLRLRIQSATARPLQKTTTRRVRSQWALWIHLNSDTAEILTFRLLS